MPKRNIPLLALAVSALLLSSPAQAAGPTGLLNDTGQTLCDNGANVMVACSAANTGNASAMPRQDGRFGRDRASPTKVGGGAAGFDFTKVCMGGTLNCATASDTGATPASTAWACTQDNVTNLIWSLQSGSGDWTPYASTTLPNATNAATRCGFSTGWRLPTRRELLSIVDNSTSNPAIDGNYFPGTQSNWYWTSDTYAPYPSGAWIVVFNGGNTDAYYKTFTYYVRLVRSGQ